MQPNALEFALMNNPVRVALQESLATIPGKPFSAHLNCSISVMLLESCNFISICSGTPQHTLSDGHDNSAVRSTHNDVSGATTEPIASQMPLVRCSPHGISCDAIAPASQRPKGARP